MIKYISIVLLFVSSFTYSQEIIKKGSGFSYGFEIGLSANSITDKRSIDYQNLNPGYLIGARVYWFPDNVRYYMNSGLRVESLNKISSLRYSIPVNLYLKIVDKNIFFADAFIGAGVRFKLDNEIYDFESVQTVSMISKFGFRTGVELNSDSSLALEFSRTSSNPYYEDTWYSAGGFPFDYTWKDAGLELGLNFVRKIN